MKYEVFIDNEVQVTLDLSGSYIPGDTAFSKFA